MDSLLSLQCPHTPRCYSTIIHRNPPEIGQKIFFRWAPTPISSNKRAWGIGVIAEKSEYCYPRILTSPNHPKYYPRYLYSGDEWRPYSEEEHALLVLAGEEVYRWENGFDRLS